MPPPLVCATVHAATIGELRARRDAVAGADLVELRLDALKSIDLAGALAGRRLPVVVTCRSPREGGSFCGSDEERRRVLDAAVSSDAEYVDLEWADRFDDLLAKRHGRGIVLSMHELEGVPRDLHDRIAAMRATGAEIVKVAVSATRLADCLALPRPDAGSAGQQTVVVAMGPAGVPTRVLATRFGSAWVFAGELAPGQIGLSELLGQYRFRRITARTALYGVAGEPLGHSLSPAIHNAALAALGLDAVYVPLASGDPDDVLGFADALGFDGLSVTAPVKVTLASRLARLEGVAARLGAVNTLTRVPDGWVGSNTDVEGFLTPLRSLDPAGSLAALRGMRASVIGAGGAARAVVAGLAGAGARVTVHARRAERAIALAAELGAEAGPPEPRAGTWDLLVNATPVGTAPDENRSPVSAACLDGDAAGRIVYDLVYNPPQTVLLHRAEAAGCRTIAGLDMLIAQAALQIERWTGREADRGVMRRAALAKLAELAKAEASRSADSACVPLASGRRLAASPAVGVT